MPPNAEFDAEVHDHDTRVAAAGLALWVGSEPTFTDRFDHAPQWLTEALGEAKEQRARELLRGLAARWPGALVLRTEGRRYPGEVALRWNLGLLQRRDGAPLWSGPPDPLLTPAELDAAAGGDELSLPDFDGDTTALCAALSACEREAVEAGVPYLRFTGCTPRVDASLALTTITPDPAVIEINAAPCDSATAFLRRSRDLYAAAAEVGLWPYRLRFNGVVADSGGGGQITLGGPSPEASPFVREPRLLPRLVRYFNHHPALSYLFCHDFVGAGGQSVRADERGLAAFDELNLALALLDHLPAPSAEQVCRALAPFLADDNGNAHRAEINIEKFLHREAGPRGRQGLVEFRALRMQHTPERATAVACLLRAIVTRLAQQDYNAPLVDWGRRLHDRQALPWVLEQDLQAVLGDLRDAGLELGPRLAATLRADEFHLQARLSLPGAVLEIRRAAEFWPLLGDAARPEQAGSSRLIDSSTARVELRLRADSAAALRQWRLCSGDAELPCEDGSDRDGPLRLWALRYRAFEPGFGLHPSLATQSPVRLQLDQLTLQQRFALTLHEWQPDGHAYPGLPEDLADAASRRAERFVVQPLPGPPPPRAASPRPAQPQTFDLRWPR